MSCFVINNVQNMSFFYLSPVKGELPLHVIETVLSNRLDFLNCLVKGENLEYNEYMIEGSIYDNVGHYMLCVTTNIYQSYTFKDFVFNSETALFKRRMDTLSTYDFRCFMKKIVKTIKKYDVVHSLHIATLYTLCQHLMLKVHAQHVNNVSHDVYCEVHKIHVNFKACLPFVAKRQVELKNGKAIIPCGLWKMYLIFLFKHYLKCKLNNGVPSFISNDPRIADLITKLIKNRFPTNEVSNNDNVLFSNTVDDHAKYFPPCMKHLHSTLRKRHRLSHQQRFHYSLFLKEIGMPMEEATIFWSNEYRKAPSGATSCSHSWEKDDKKYLYSIRHMYGLEGARKSYNSANCTRLQMTINVSSEGGCPFKYFDEKNITQLLNLNAENMQKSQINKCIINRNYNTACMKYHKLLFPDNILENCDNTYNFSPVIYYQSALTSQVPK